MRTRTDLVLLAPGQVHDDDDRDRGEEDQAGGRGPEPEAAIGFGLWFIDHRTEQLIRVAKLISTIGSFASLSIMGLVLGLVLWRRWRVLAFAPLAALVVASLLSTAAKALFDRNRPPVAVHATTVTLAAFPSGHATDAAAFFLAASLTLALTVARRRSVQLALLATGLMLAVLVGLSRLVLGVHWLSDVVAGWALGSAVAITVVTGAWYLTARGGPDPLQTDADSLPRPI